MAAFAPHSLAADLAEVRRLYSSLFSAASDIDWERQTERGNTGWTLRETVGHLDSVARNYEQMIEAALAGRSHTIPGMTRRTDLSSWLQHEIDVRAKVPIQTVCDSFLARLQGSEESLTVLTPAQLARTIHFPVYEQTVTVAELLGGQAVHPGLVHAAQVTNGLGVAPLWVHFAPDMLHRQITRLFHLMALAYWPERGGDLQATINFIALGQQGGSWHLTIAPNSCQAGQGRVSRPTLTMWFRNTEVLCRIFTLQLGPVRASLTGQAWGWGDLRLGFRLEHLFLPT